MNLLEKELIENGIEYDKVDNNYIIKIHNSNLNLSLLTSNILSLKWSEREPSERKLVINIEFENYKHSEKVFNFLFAFIYVIERNEGEIHSDDTDFIYDINKLLKEFKIFNTIKVEIINKKDDKYTNDLKPYSYEKPLSSDEIKQEMEDALTNNDKEKYYKFQAMLKENNSFKYMKNFKDFFD